MMSSSNPVTGGLPSDLAAIIAQELAARAADALTLSSRLSIGEVVSAVVLPSNGLTDLLDIDGLRVAAELPPSLVPGEQITVMVTGFESDRISLQIIPTPPQATGESAAPPEPSRRSSTARIGPRASSGSKDVSSEHTPAHSAPSTIASGRAGPVAKPAASRSTQTVPAASRTIQTSVAAAPRTTTQTAPSIPRGTYGPPVTARAIQTEPAAPRATQTEPAEPRATPTEPAIPRATQAEPAAPRVTQGAPRAAQRVPAPALAAGPVRTIEARLAAARATIPPGGRVPSTQPLREAGGKSASPIPPVRLDVGPKSALPAPSAMTAATAAARAALPAAARAALPTSAQTALPTGTQAASPTATRAASPTGMQAASASATQAGSSVAGDPTLPAGVAAVASQNGLVVVPQAPSLASGSRVAAPPVRSAASYAQPAALLRALRLPVTATNLASARMALEAPDKLPNALATLERALANDTDPRVATLSTLTSFVARLDPRSPVFATQIAAFVDHVVTGREAKIAQLASASDERLPAESPAGTSASALPVPAGSERIAVVRTALEYDLKTQLLALVAARASSAETATPKAAALDRAVVGVLSAITALQLDAATTLAANPDGLAFSIPIALPEGFVRARVRIDREATEGGKGVLDGDNFHIAFVLETQHLGTVAIDLMTASRTVTLSIKTETAPAQRAFGSALRDLTTRLEALRYRVAKADAVVAPVAPVESRDQPTEVAGSTLTDPMLAADPARLVDVDA